MFSYITIGISSSLFHSWMMLIIITVIILNGMDRHRVRYDYLFIFRAHLNELSLPRAAKKRRSQQKINTNTSSNSSFQRGYFFFFCNHQYSILYAWFVCTFGHVLHSSSLLFLFCGFRPPFCVRSIHLFI